MMTVPLHGKIAAQRVALVDDADYELVMQYRWHVLEQKRPGRFGGPYAATNLPDYGDTMLLHTLITGWPRVDHIDHDGLNCQRFNMRPVTGSQNQWNRRPNARSTSAYKGVNWDALNGKWLARICVRKHQRNLGRYVSEIDAARAYDAAAREAFGEYAFLNFP
jgi:hypothetical protein